MDESEILRIQSNIAGGQLPKVDCLVTWYHSGRGELCAVCARRILSTEPAIECDLPGGTTVWFHVPCHARWQEARER